MGREEAGNLAQAVPLAPPPLLVRRVERLCLEQQGQSKKSLCHQAGN